MSATDVSLPGVLPLVLERHHVSGHPCGGWFGRTWAGTLDQRLEIDDAGVVYITDDGMLLTYPVPERDAPVLPASGPRWPLRWDGKPDGAFTITVPERNRTLHFAPLPLGGRELALKAITDRTSEGDRIEIAYDEQGAPTEVTHSGGYRIAIDTDPTLLRITALRLLHGEGHEQNTTLISCGYDEAGDLTEAINSTGLPLRYQYDPDGNVTEIRELTTGTAASPGPHGPGDRRPAPRLDGEVRLRHGPQPGPCHHTRPPGGGRPGLPGRPRPPYARQSPPGTPIPHTRYPRLSPRPATHYSF
ncbi:RHS repeat domain-containing protein [Streptomyces sparsogenes]